MDIYIWLLCILGGLGLMIGIMWLMIAFCKHKFADWKDSIVLYFEICVILISTSNLIFTLVHSLAT